MATGDAGRLPGGRAPAATAVEGCALFEDIVTAEDEAALVAWVESELARGRSGALVGRTYATPPPKWASRGQSRETLMYGVCTHANRVQPDVAVQRELPAPLARVAEALVRAGALPPMGSDDSKRTTTTDLDGAGADAGAAARSDGGNLGKRETLVVAGELTCCINAYAAGEFLPPHVDAAAFARPFTTVSLQSDHVVLFGRAEELVQGERRGEWLGGVPVAIPRRSAVILGGPAGGPDLLHALPCHPARRISLTFRRVSADAAAAFAAEAARLEQLQHGRRLAKRAAKEARRASKQRGAAAGGGGGNGGSGGRKGE